jgi:uncharacterized membrane protein
MSRVRGHASVEIAAPILDVFTVAADIERTPEWQPGLDDVVVLERDSAGYQVRTSIVTSHGAGILRFTHTEPTRIAWVQEEGAAAHFAGAWHFEACSGSLTRATYEVDLDLGRGVGFLVRGPLATKLRERFVDAMPMRLQAHVEALVI